jgi:hypothetical protein
VNGPTRLHRLPDLTQVDGHATDKKSGDFDSAPSVVSAVDDECKDASLKKPIRCI